MAVEQALVIGDDAPYPGTKYVTVPSSYGDHVALPQRLAILVEEAALSLQQVYVAMVAAKGHLYISDMFRSFEDQERAYLDWLHGRKAAYSPPPCGSVHEAARAIDINAFDTGIGHAATRKILNDCGWVNITPSLTGSECWHYEYRGTQWEAYHDANGYAQMARAMKVAIKNTGAQPHADAKMEEIRTLQTELNKVMATHLVPNGVYNQATKDAVRAFQSFAKIQVDGIAGPITKAKLHSLYVLGK